MSLAKHRDKWIISMFLTLPMWIRVRDHSRYASQVSPELRDLLSAICGLGGDEATAKRLESCVVASRKRIDAFKKFNTPSRTR